MGCAREAFNEYENKKFLLIPIKPFKGTNRLSLLVLRLGAYYASQHRHCFFFSHFAFQPTHRNPPYPSFKQNPLSSLLYVILPNHDNAKVCKSILSPHKILNYVNQLFSTSAFARPYIWLHIYLVIFWKAFLKSSKRFTLLVQAFLISL